VIGQFRDFIEKQGAVGSGFEASDTAFPGAGEGAFFVPEQFAFDQLFGNGGAVDGNKLPIFPLAMCMNATRYQLLAHAAFTGYQHGEVIAGEQPHQFENLLHGGATADQLIAGGCSICSGGLCTIRCGGRLRSVQGALQQGAYLWQLDWFAQVIESTRVHGFHCGVDGAVGRHHNNRQLRVAAVDICEGRQAAHVRHLHVHEYHFRPFLFHQLQRLLAGGCNQRRVPFAAQQFAERFANSMFIVGNQDFCHRGTRKTLLLLAMVDYLYRETDCKTRPAQCRTAVCLYSTMVQFD